MVACAWIHKSTGQKKNLHPLAWENNIFQGLNLPQDTSIENEIETEAIEHCID